MKGFFTLILAVQAIPAALGRRTGDGGGGGGGDTTGGTGGSIGGTGGTGGTTGHPDSTHHQDSGVDAIPVDSSPSKDYSLGQYTSNRQTPFEDSKGEWKPYYSQVDSILKAKPKKTTVIVRFHNHNGHGTTAVVQQSLATSACDAWSSLSVYCGGAGTSCACYSGTYYVPDQWNTLADYCAQAVVTVATTEASTTITSSSSSAASTSDSKTLTESGLAEQPELAKRASSFTKYCPTTGRPTVVFGAVAPTSTSTTRNSAGSTSITTTDLFKWKIPLVLASSALLFAV